MEARPPPEVWDDKINRNEARDAEVNRALEGAGGPCSASGTSSSSATRKLAWGGSAPHLITPFRSLDRSIACASRIALGSGLGGNKAAPG